MRKESVRKLFLAALMVVMVLLMSAAAFAASAPKLTKAQGGAALIRLSWTKVKNARGYYIYLRGKDEAEAKRAATVKSASTTSYILKKMTPNSEYVVYVTSFDAKGESGKSNLKKVRTASKELQPVEGVTAIGKDKKILLKWKKNSGADGYVIYQKNKDGQYEIVKSVRKRNKIYIQGLKNGQSYYFRVASYKKIDGQKVIGVPSETVGAQVFNTKAIKSVHPYYYSGTMRRTVQSGKVTFKAGQKVVVAETSGSTATLIYKKKEYKVPSGAVSTHDFVTNNKKSPSKELAEQFVNYKGYDSKTGYFIWVNTYSQYVYVFKGSRHNWKCLKKYICSTGRIGTRTPLGDGVITGKVYRYPWTPMQYFYYGLYKSRGGGWFHSWLYYPSGQIYTGIGTLGKPASHGCIRMNKNDIKWIYENVPTGTRYMVY